MEKIETTQTVSLRNSTDLTTKDERLQMTFKARNLEIIIKWINFCTSKN